MSWGDLRRRNSLHNLARWPCASSLRRRRKAFGGDPTKAAELLDQSLRELTGFRLDEETPLPYAPAVRVPTLMAQLRRDFLIHGERDGQAIFDALGAKEKELLWIVDSNQRFCAYNHFGRRPERLVGWFGSQMQWTSTERIKLTDRCRECPNLPIAKVVLSRRRWARTEHN
jgi:hypothetical protein